MITMERKQLVLRKRTPQKDEKDTSNICNIICSIWEQLGPYLSFFSKINLFMVRKDLYNALKSAKKIPQPLYVHQIPHFKRVMQCIRTYGRVIDSSEPGLGKTYVTAFIAYVTGKPLIVFGPESTRKVWLEASEFYGIEHSYFYSYGVFQRRSKPIPFVEKDEYGEYQATQDWINITSSGIGVHLVYDEVHWLRNESKRNKLASIIAQTALNSGRSVMSYLSGSLMEMQKQCNPYLRLLGLTPIEKVDDNMENLQEATQNLFGGLIIPPDKIGIFNDLVCNRLRSAMEPIPRLMKACNYFMDVGQHDLNLINAGINALENAINQHEATHYITLLANIECSKSPSYVRRIRDKLTKHNNKKVIIMLNYTRPLKYIAKQLAEFNPIVIDGKVKQEHRPGLITKFQESSTKHRLIVANIAVLGESVGLDDIHGKFPRELYLSPGNSLTKLQQGMRRVDRGPRTMSQAKVKILYAHGAEREVGILERLQQKSVIMEKSLGYDTVLPNKLPSKYETP